MTGQWFSQGTLVSSTNKTDHHDITEILLKVALSTMNQTKPHVDLHDLFCVKKKVVLKIYCNLALFTKQENHLKMSCESFQR